MAVCSLCEKSSENNSLLVKYPKGFVCQGCLHIGVSELDKAQVNQEKTQQKEEFLKPKEIKKCLDDYIIGQDRAKKVLATAVFNHLCRINTKKKLDKSNIIIFGPTGCGKTFILKNLARILDFPIAITGKGRITTKSDVSVLYA